MIISLQLSTFTLILHLLVIFFLQYKMIAHLNITPESWATHQSCTIVSKIPEKRQEMNASLSKFRNIQFAMIRFQIPREWRKTVGMMECQSWTTFQRLEKRWGHDHQDTRPSHKTISQDHQDSRPSQMLIALHIGYTPLHKPKKTNKKKSKS